MNYITTNIRLPEKDYLKLKEEAAKNRKSLSAVVREKLKSSSGSRSEEEVATLMAEITKQAAQLGSKLKGFDSVKALREMRYENKW